MPGGWVTSSRAGTLRSLVASVTVGCVAVTSSGRPEAGRDTAITLDGGLDGTAGVSISGVRATAGPRKGGIVKAEGDIGAKGGGTGGTTRGAG